MDYGEDIDYRSPSRLGNPDNVFVKDEQEFSSLKDAEKTLRQAIDSLYKEFNAFDLSESELSIKEQIAVNQKAYSILMPVHEQVKSAIADVKAKTGA